MNSDAGEKIKMLKGSIQCLMFGLLGLLPLIGLPFALATLWMSGRVRIKEKIFWNAARPYRIGGIVIATVGTLFWFIIVVLIAYNSVNHDGSGGISSLSGDE